VVRLSDGLDEPNHILLWHWCEGASAASRSANNIGNQDRSELSDLAFRDSPPPCDKHEDPIVAAPRIAEAHWASDRFASDDLFYHAVVNDRYSPVLLKKPVFLKAATGFGPGCQRGKVGPLRLMWRRSAPEGG
jgi:hypothetical protein